jgi:hypothetical protein
VLSHPERPFCGHAGGLCWGRRHDGAPRANVVRTRSGSGGCADGGYGSTLSHRPGLDQPFPCPLVVHLALSRPSRPATRVVVLHLPQWAGHMGEPAAEVPALCPASRCRRPVVDAVSCTAELVASLGHRLGEATVAVFGRPIIAASSGPECSVCTGMHTPAGADRQQPRRYGRCRAGRTTISLTSTSAGWSIA